MTTAPPERELFHTRTITCTGHCRSDGLWDVEGELVDTRTYASFPIEGDRRVPPGAPFHHMRMRITVDDGYVIRAATAATLASPYVCCGEIGPSYEKLVGLRLAAGFTAAVRERLGGRAGCTHLTELLSPMATTAFQTIPAGRAKRDEGKPGASTWKELDGFVDSCHALSADGEVTRRFRAALAADATPDADAPRAPAPASPGDRS
jgi:hypothetical protein